MKIQLLKNENRKNTFVAIATMFLIIFSIVWTFDFLIAKSNGENALQKRWKSLHPNNCHSVVHLENLSSLETREEKILIVFLHCKNCKECWKKQEMETNHIFIRKKLWFRDTDRTWFIWKVWQGTVFCIFICLRMSKVSKNGKRFCLKSSLFWSLKISDADRSHFSCTSTFSVFFFLCCGHFLVHYRQKFSPVQCVVKAKLYSMTNGVRLTSTNGYRQANVFRKECPGLCFLDPSRQTVGRQSAFFVFYRWFFRNMSLFLYETHSTGLWVIHHEPSFESREAFHRNQIGILSVSICTILWECALVQILLCSRSGNND